MVRQRGIVYAADERGNSITVIDLSTGQGKAIATRISPHNAQVSRDGRRLLLAAGTVAAMTGNESQKKMNDDGKMERGRIRDTETNYSWVSWLVLLFTRKKWHR